MPTLKTGLSTLVGALFVLAIVSRPPARLHALSTYDDAVLADTPVGYWTIAPDSTIDQSGHGLDGTFTGSPAGTTMPNGDAAAVFNGVDQYFTVADSDYLEITQTGILTIEAWMRPDVLQFTNSESSGYVHWMGKGVSGQHSWVARMYNLTNSENRPNRISGYAFNLTGGLGAGSYFQDPVTAGEWIHYTLVINTVNTSPAYPTGYTKIFKNGVQRDQDSLSDYDIVPGNGTAPMRVGTRDFASFFEGAIGKVAVYDYELTAAQLLAHNSAMTGGGGGPTPPDAPSNLTATAGNKRITLTWTAPAQSVTYKVSRSTTSGGPYTQIRQGVTQTSYTDRGLSAGTYYYVVTAVANGLESATSNEASATVN